MVTAGPSRSFGESAPIVPKEAALSAKVRPRASAPRLLVVTDRRQVAGSLADVIAAAVDGGARHVLLRERDLPRSQRLALARELRAILTAVGGRLIVAGPDPLLPDDAGWEAGGRAIPAGTELLHDDERGPGGRAIVAGPDPLWADHVESGDRTGGAAVHLSAYDPLPGTPGGPPGTATLIGRSCHDDDSVPSTVDYVTFSPIFASASKPGYGPVLGGEGLRRFVTRTRKPVLALGGIESAAQVAACLAAGAHGVAVMGAVMRSAQPRHVIRELSGAGMDSLCDVSPPHGSTVMP